MGVCFLCLRKELGSNPLTTTRRVEYVKTRVFPQVDPNRRHSLVESLGYKIDMPLFDILTFTLKHIKQMGKIK